MREHRTSAGCLARHPYSTVDRDSRQVPGLEATGIKPAPDAWLSIDAVITPRPRLHCSMIGARCDVRVSGLLLIVAGLRLR